MLFNGAFPALYFVSIPSCRHFEFFSGGGGGWCLCIKNLRKRALVSSFASNLSGWKLKKILHFKTTMRSLSNECALWSMAASEREVPFGGCKGKNDARWRSAMSKFCAMEIAQSRTQGSTQLGLCNQHKIRVFHCTEPLVFWLHSFHCTEFIFASNPEL